MRSKQFISVAAALAVMCVLAGAVYAYDHGRRDKIAKGISVGGVNIGGLSKAAAERKLEAEYLAALHEPIVVHHGKKTWKLGPREAHTAADIAAMVDQALARSRDGNIFSRTFRGLTGGEVRDNLTPTVTYSKAAVVRLLDKVRKSVDRDAIDAKLNFHGADFSRSTAATAWPLTPAACTGRSTPRSSVPPRTGRSSPAPTTRSPRSRPGSWSRSTTRC
jgi:hypothetical protein